MFNSKKIETQEVKLSKDHNIKNNDNTSNNNCTILNIAYSSNLVQNNKIYLEKNIYKPELLINNNIFIKRFICGLCKNICVEPRYQYCGCESAFCKKCLYLYYDSNHQKCPKCKKETKELIPNNSFSESILNLNMKCRNISCKWIGKLKDYKEHIYKICPKEFINCPNKGCIIKLRREEMPKHIPNCQYIEYICDKCHTKMNLVEKKSHKNICVKEKVKCPRGCGSFIERDNLNEHEKNCVNSYIDCPYNFLGCKDKFFKKEKDARLIKDAYIHLDLAIEKIKNLSKEVLDLNDKLNILVNDKNDLKNEINELKDIIIQKNNLSNINENNLINNENLFEDINNSPNKKEANEIINKYINNSESKKNSQDKKRKRGLLRSPEIDISSQKKSCQYLSKKRKLPLKEKENSIKSNQEFSLFSNNEEDKEDKEDKEEKNVDKENYLDYNLTKEGKNEEIYDLLESTNNIFSIRGNIIESPYLEGDKHYFVFFNQKYDIPKTSIGKYSFKIKLLQKIDWLGVGFCDRKIVENNNYEYDIKKHGKKRNMGIYIINTNHVVWNCNNMKQCIRLNYKSLNKNNTIIECTLLPDECEIEFMLNNEFFFILNDVRCFASECFSPCLIFLKNASLETTFNYN